MLLPLRLPLLLPDAPNLSSHSSCSRASASSMEEDEGNVLLLCRV